MRAGFEGVLGGDVSHRATIYLLFYCSIVELSMSWSATDWRSQRRSGFLQCVRLPGSCLAHSSRHFKVN